MLEVHKFNVTTQTRANVSNDGTVFSVWSGTCPANAALPFAMDLELVLADWAVSPPATLNVEGRDTMEVFRDDDRLATHHRLSIDKHLKGGA